jgi:hypothetical protein
VYLYALVARDSAFAVDVFISREAAGDALAEVLLDEPALAPLLDIAELQPPWRGKQEVVTDPHRQ